MLAAALMHPLALTDQGQQFCVHGWLCSLLCARSLLMSTLLAEIDTYKSKTPSKLEHLQCTYDCCGDHRKHKVCQLCCDTYNVVVTT